MFVLLLAIAGVIVTIAVLAYVERRLSELEIESSECSNAADAAWAEMRQRLSSIEEANTSTVEPPEKWAVVDAFMRMDYMKRAVDAGEISPSEADLMRKELAEILERNPNVA